MAPAAGTKDEQAKLRTMAAVLPSSGCISLCWVCFNYFCAMSGTSTACALETDCEFFEQVGVLLFVWVIGFSLFYPFFAAMTPVFP